MHTVRLSLVLASVVALGACVADDADDAQTAQALSHHHHHHDHHHDHRRLDVAWLGNDPANAYDNANLDGARAVAHDDNARVTAKYAGFDPSVQLDQCFDAVESCRYDAIVIIPDDPVGILPCLEAAADDDVPVVATDLPIGPDLTTPEPQAEGQVGAVLTPAAAWGVELASLLVDACDGLDPCNVVYVAGAFGIAFDDMALAQLAELSADLPSIQVVATGEAFYDRGLAASVVADLLAANPDVQVVIGAGDQMAQGAEDVIGGSGTIKIIGAGGGAYAIGAVQAGRWYADYLALPRDEGVLGTRIALRAARHLHVADPGIDPVAAHGWPAFYTRDNQALFAGFTPQWPG